MSTLITSDKVYDITNDSNINFVTVGGVGVRFINGGWSSLQLYQVNNAVAYQGTTYRCLQQHSNQEPPNATYWEPMAAKGEDGSRTVSLTQPGTLENTTGVARWYPRTDNTIFTEFEAFLGTVSTANVVIVINKNGSQVATGTITAGQYKMAKQLGLSISLDVSDYLTVDITADDGSDLTVRLGM